MYRVTTVWTGPHVQGGGVNHLYFDQGGGTGAQAHAAVVSFWSALQAYISNLDGFTVLGEIELVDTLSGQVEGVETTDQVAYNGTATGAPLPPASQALVRWRTGSFANGREIRGRTFVPGLTTESLSGGSMSSTAVTAFNVAAGNLIGNANSELVVWSKTHGVFATVVSASTWAKFATLRSRRD